MGASQSVFSEEELQDYQVIKLLGKSRLSYICGISKRVLSSFTCLIVTSG